MRIVNIWLLGMSNIEHFNNIEFLRSWIKSRQIIVLDCWDL